MPATVDLNRVKHMARVLLEKYCEICLLHPSRNDIRVVVMLVGDFVGPMEPITFICSGIARLLELIGKRSINI